MDDQSGDRRSRACASSDYGPIRVSSRGEADFADKLLSAMRFQFGGHLEKSDSKTKVA